MVVPCVFSALGFMAGRGTFRDKRRTEGRERLERVKEEGQSQVQTRGAALPNLTIYIINLYC